MLSWAADLFEIKFLKLNLMSVIWTHDKDYTDS